MVQPKYSPEEALQRIKLMMEYNTSKTLDENIQMISEQTNCDNSITMDAAIEKIKAIAEQLEAFDTVFERMGQDETDAKEIYDNISEIIKHNIYDSLDDSCQPGSTVLRNLYKKEHAKVSAWGTDDLLELLKELTTGYWENDSSIQRYIKAAIKLVETGSSPMSNKKNDVVNPIKDKKTDNSKKTGTYKSCSGTYSYGCKANAIAQVQGCLGLTTDGKFGPKTKAALSGKGFTTFTDKDITKICSTIKPNETPQDEFSVQVDGERIDDILNM